jgi:putative transposase
MNLRRLAFNWRQFEWYQEFGADYARKLMRREGPLGDHWYLDEVLIRINGRLQYWWRAVDQDRDVIDIRAEVSHQPTRYRERQMRRFKSASHLPTVSLTP